MNTDEHVEFLSYILGICRQSWTNVICLTVDKVSMSNALSNKTSVPFILCGSHRFNLAMFDFLAGDEYLLYRINSIMAKLRILF